MATVYRLTQPCVAGTAYIFTGCVFDQDSPNPIQTSPTLAAADFTFFRDGAYVNTLTTLPTESGATGILTFTITAAETTGATRDVAVKCSDAAGSEWNDVLYIIPVKEAVTVSESTAIEVADAILKRDVANVEATASNNSLTELILAAFKSSIVDALQTIYETDGVTTFNTRTVTLDEDAKPITGVT